MHFSGRWGRYLPSLFILAIGLLLSYGAYSFVAQSLFDQKRIEFETLSANFIIKIQDEINHETSLLNSIITSLSLAPSLFEPEKLDIISEKLVHKQSTINSLAIIGYNLEQQSYRLNHWYSNNTNTDFNEHFAGNITEALHNGYDVTNTVFPHTENHQGREAQHSFTIFRTIPSHDDRPQENNEVKLILVHIDPEQAFKNTLNKLLPNWLDLYLYTSNDRQYQLRYHHVSHENSTPVIQQLMNRPEHSLFLPGSIDLYGEPLSILLAPSESYFSATTPLARYIMVLGILLSIALAAYVETLRRRNVFIRQQVIERTEAQEKLNQALVISVDSHKEDLKKLKRSEKDLRSLVNSVDGVLWEADIKSQKITYISQQTNRILRFSPDEIMALPGGLVDLVHPEDRTSYLAALKDIRPGSYPQREFRVYDATQEVVYIRDILSPVIENNEITRIRGVMLDVSKYKKMGQERIKMEAQLRQAQKLESVGQLAAGIAHEINTPAQFVSDNIKFIIDSFNDLKALQHLYDELSELQTGSPEFEQKSEQIREHKKAIDLDFLLEDIPEALTQSFDGITRISSIVKAMKEFSHPGSDSMETIDINHAIDNTITVARNEWRYVAEIEKDFDCELPLVECLPGEFNQVILNMVVNAAQAINEQQTINKDASMGRIRIKTFRNDQKVCIHISDNGAGINKDKIERIFDPFFTTKEVGKGTGQGLAIAYSVIVDKHKGNIDVTSTEGEGTTFMLEIPLKQTAS